MQCLGDGYTNEQIVSSLAGDIQLYDMWISFVLHNKWMKKDEYGVMQLTDKGKSWMARYYPE
jgi:hypothetical protein